MGLCCHGGPSGPGTWAHTTFAAGSLRPNVSGGVGMARDLLLGCAVGKTEAMTCWALAPPGQEALGCWAGWRCLPSVYSLYLSIKPLHPSSDLVRGVLVVTCSNRRFLSSSSLVRMGTGWPRRAQAPQLCSLVPL